MAFKIDFNKLKNMSEEEKLRLKYKDRLYYARLCMEGIKNNKLPMYSTVNREVFSILENLGGIPELNINIDKYRYLQTKEALDAYALCDAKKFIKQAEEILK